ncbi:SnoaL-like domain-containing protein [Amycolatopsis lurida]|uniref:Dehydratase n=1 Tax=Amycolatopsis lurida NRRL 2430 TaxID=1460371 RepID=A0A2P2FLX0_AMYLU|nr:nuclear transport factor 2 family protein [Amycolatopsis lurida]KFU77709.1 dehydratase [Amycolatopsis lurida NRRL 2430]SEB40038.1 SnoaL-like domain-containing protein [Amycolatopsis lurida]
MDDLTRLVAVEDVRRVMARYVYSADHHRWDDLAALFTPDAPFIASTVDGSTQARMTGRDEIADRLKARNQADSVLVHHLFSSEIDIESQDSAAGVWAMEDIVATPHDGEMHGYGHYRVRFTRSDGHWLIAELRITRLRLDWTHPDKENRP